MNTKHPPIRPGDRFGRLTVHSRSDRPSTTRDPQWLVVCDCGDIRVCRDANLKRGLSRSCGAPEHRRRSTRISYREAHKRLGRASDHTCPCGAPAEQWSYDHRDPDELSEEPRPRPEGHPWGHFQVLTYSVKPEHYTALCRACHHRFDIEHHKAKGAASA